MDKLGCERLFDREQAESVQALIVAATGHRCPCSDPCALLNPDDVA